MGNGSSGQVHPSGPEGAPERPLSSEEQVGLEMDGPPRPQMGQSSRNRGTRGPSVSPRGLVGRSGSGSADELPDVEDEKAKPSLSVVRRVPLQCADLLSNALQLAQKEAGADTARTRARWVLGPDGSWKTVGTMSNSKKIDLRDEVLRVFYGVHTTVTGADGVQQEQRLPCARVTVSRRGFTPAVVTVVEGQVVAFESVPSFAPPAAEKDKDKEKAKEKGKAKLPDELPMPPGGYNVVQLSQDGAQFKVMPGGRNFRLENKNERAELQFTSAGEFRFGCGVLKCPPIRVRVLPAKPHEVRITDKGFSERALYIFTGSCVRFISGDRAAIKSLSLGSLCLEHCGLRRTPLSQATLAEQCLVRFAMPGTHYVAAQPSNGHPALLAVCVSEGGREQHEVRVADEAFEEELLVTSQGARVTWSWAPDAPLPYACSLHHCVYEAELAHHTFDARAPDAVPTIHKPATKGVYWTKPSARGQVSLVCEEPGVRAIADYTNLDVFSARVSAVLALPHVKSHSVAVLADGFQPEMLSTRLGEKLWFGWPPLGGFATGHYVQLLDFSILYPPADKATASAAQADADTADAGAEAETRVGWHYAAPLEWSRTLAFCTSLEDDAQLLQSRARCPTCADAKSAAWSSAPIEPGAGCTELTKAWRSVVAQAGVQCLPLNRIGVYYFHWEAANERAVDVAAKKRAKQRKSEVALRIEDEDGGEQREQQRRGAQEDTGAGRQTRTTTTPQDGGDVDADADVELPNVLAVVVRFQPQNHWVAVGDSAYMPDRLLVYVHDNVWFVWRQTSSPRNVMEVLPDGRRFARYETRARPPVTEQQPLQQPQQFEEQSATEEKETEKEKVDEEPEVQAKRIEAHEVCSGPLMHSPYAFQWAPEKVGIYRFCSSNDTSGAYVFVEVRAPNDVREVSVRTSAVEPQLLVVRPGDTVCWNLKVNTAEPLCLVAAQGVQLVSWPMPKSGSLKNVPLTEPSSSSSSSPAQNTNVDAPADAAAASGDAAQPANDLNAGGGGGSGGAEVDLGARSTTSSENKLATASGGVRERFQRRCLAQLFTEAGMYNVSSRAFTFQNSGGDRENKAAGTGAEWSPPEEFVSTVIVDDMPSEEEFVPHVYNAVTGMLSPRQLFVKCGQTVVWFPYDYVYRAVSMVDAEVVTIEPIAADVVDTILESSDNENPVEEGEGERKGQSSTKNATLADGAAASNANPNSVAAGAGAQTLQSYQTTGDRLAVFTFLEEGNYKITIGGTGLVGVITVALKVKRAPAPLIDAFVPDLKKRRTNEDNDTVSDTTQPQQVRFKFSKRKRTRPTAADDTEVEAPEKLNWWQRGAKVYYTLDGSVPFPGRLSTFTYEYEDEVELPVGRFFVVRARTVVPGLAFSPVVTSRRYWVKPREEELLQMQETGVVPTRPLDGVLAVTPFRSLKMTAKLASPTGCLELSITQPFARAERRLGNKLGLLINRRLYPHWFEIDTARLYVNCMVPSRPYELILVFINEDTGAVVRKSNAVTMVFPTRLIFGRLMPVISATFSSSSSHPKKLYDALVVWRPLESHIRYGAVNYVLHLNETTLEYRLPENNSQGGPPIELGWCSITLRNLRFNQLYVAQLEAHHHNPRVEEGDYSLWSNMLPLRLAADKITSLAQNRLSINDAGQVAEVPREWDEMYSPFATGPQFRATSAGYRRADEFLELLQVYTWEEYSDELAIGLQMQPVPELIKNRAEAEVMATIERAQDEEDKDEYEVEEEEAAPFGGIGFLNRHLSSQLGPTLVKRRGSFLKQMQSSGLMLTRGFRRGATDEGELDETIFTVSALTANISA